MAFATKYRLEFDEVKTNPSNMATSYTPISWKIEILEDAFAGTVTNLIGTSDPLRIVWDKINLYEDWVMASHAIINLDASTTLQYSEFITGGETDYRVDIYRDGTLYWQGYISPGDYEEDYTYASGIPVRLKAVDMLARLDDDIILYTAPRTLITSFAAILNTNLSMSLPIVENVNLYEDRQSSTAANSPFTQTTLKSSPQRWWTSKLFIDEVLKNFQAILYQSEGKWRISRIPLNDGSTFTERLYNSSGVYQSNTTGVSNVIEVTGVGNAQARIQSTLILARPIKTTKLTVDNSSEDFPLANKNFNFATDGYFNLWETTTKLSRWTNTGVTIQRSTMSTGYYCKITSSSLSPTGGATITTFPTFQEEGSAFNLTFKYKWVLTGTGTNPQFAYQVKNVDKDGNVEYWNGSAWTSTTSNITITSVPNEFDRFVHYLENITATSYDGYISIKFYEPDPNGYTFTSFNIAHCAINPSGIKNLTYEEIYQIGETAEVIGDIHEQTFTIGDRGNVPIRLDSGTRNYEETRIRIDFAAIVNNDEFSIDLSELTYTYVYQSVPTLPIHFSNKDELLVLIRADISQDEYSAYNTLVSGSTYDFFIRANFHDNEKGKDYAFNYADNNTHMSEVGSTANLDSFDLRDMTFLIGTNLSPAGRWSDGSVSGALLDVYQQCVHNQFGRVWQRHKGKLHDFTKNHTASSVIHDATHNNGRYFMFVGGTLNCVEGIMDGEWHEVYTGTKAFTKTIENIK